MFPTYIVERALPALFAGARSGSMDIAILFANGLITDVDSYGPKGWTALLFAVGGGHIEVAHFLLEQGASTESRTHQSLTPIHLAAARGDIEMVDLLCRFGANITTHGAGGKRAIDFAHERGFANVVSYLEDYGATIDPDDDNGATVLDDILARQDAAALRAAVEDDEIVLRHDANGKTAFMRACMSGNTDWVFQIIEALDEAGLSVKKIILVNMYRGDGWTPLNVAADRGDFDLVVFLIHHGADLEIKNINGFSPLQSAAAKGRDDVVQYLLEAGANPESTHSEGSTALITAAIAGFESCVDMLLEHGANVDHRNNNGYTVLHHAVMANHTSIVKKLLAHTANLDIGQEDGWTPLMLAAERGNYQVAQVLIDGGADVNSESFDHWTPLTAAVKKQSTDLCSLLLHHNALATKQMADGKTALHLAASNGDYEITRLMLAAGADATIRDFDGHTAEDIARRKGNFTVAELLRPLTMVETEEEDEIWPRYALDELYGLLDSGSDSVKSRQNPSWWIDRSSINSQEPFLLTYTEQVWIGTWMGSRVAIVEPAFSPRQMPGEVGTIMLRSFRKEITQHFPLRHPHVIKLYGACHRAEKPFLVREHPQNGTLRSYVTEHPQRTWAMLHEVALGLQYLHERGIVHGRLYGGNILIGDDGLAKLAGFGSYSTSMGKSFNIAWNSPEVLGGGETTMESDVYSLGMCIVEAVTGYPPYTGQATTRAELIALITNGIAPSQPASMSNGGWNLVKQMICSQSHKRMKIAEVVSELEALKRDEQNQVETLVRRVPDDFDVNEAFRHALALLIVTAEKEDDYYNPDLPLNQVFHRLANIWLGAGGIDPYRLKLLMPRLVVLLLRFIKHFQKIKGRGAYFAAQRQFANRIFAFHSELDRIVSEHPEALVHASLHPSTEFIHNWQDRWREHRRAELEKFGDALERVDRLDVEESTCLLFELTRHHSAYSGIPPQVIHAACSRMRSILGVRVPKWFIPYYEVEYDDNSFKSGAFGSVYFGWWNGSRVVIKVVHSAATDDNASEFEREVELWSELYHPHVLQLFGACHVGQKFIVSESAEHGQLDEYLRGLVHQPSQRGGDVQAERAERRRREVHRKREAWRTLHETALGLQYLHLRQIVHCDLKCNNILVGRDKTAKLSDYGLSQKQQARVQDSSDDEEKTDSSTHQHNPPNIGAPRWKAPEVLNGGRPTFESDVYSFGMCVVEALTGEYPWGMERRDNDVRHHVREGGKLFDKPPEFTDEQWNLVLGACCPNPHERLKLQEIIDRLKEFAEGVIEEEVENEDEVAVYENRSSIEEVAKTHVSDSEAISAPTRPPEITNSSDGLFD